MNHDPLCYMAEGKWDGGCQCPLIARVRDDERWATVEGAVFVASQYGTVPELVQLLSKLYEAPEIQMDDEMRREAARELTQLAQEMGMIP